MWGGCHWTTRCNLDHGKKWPPLGHRDLKVALVVQRVNYTFWTGPNRLAERVWEPPPEYPMSGAEMIKSAFKITKAQLGVVFVEAAAHEQWEFASRN